MIGIWLEDCAIHFPFSFSIISLWTGRIVPLVWKELQDSPTYVKFCLYVCGWQCLFKSPGGQNLTWESLSATEEEGDSSRAWEPTSGEDALAWALSPSQLYHPCASSPKSGHAWAEQKAIQLITSDSGQKHVLTGEYRSRKKQTALPPSLQGCPEEGFLSWLPPSHSACISPSHQSS